MQFHIHSYDSLPPVLVGVNPPEPKNLLFLTSTGSIPSYICLCQLARNINGQFMSCEAAAALARFCNRRCNTLAVLADTTYWSRSLQTRMSPKSDLLIMPGWLNSIGLWICILWRTLELVKPTENKFRGVLSNRSSMGCGAEPKAIL